MAATFICLPSPLLTNVPSLLPILQHHRQQYISTVLLPRPARLIVWLLLPSVLQLITEYYKLQQVN